MNHENPIKNIDSSTFQQPPGSENSTPISHDQTRWKDAFARAEALIASDFQRIDQMVQNGGLSLRSGAELKDYVLRKAFEMSTTKTQAEKAVLQPQQDQSPGPQVLQEIEPGFFTGREPLQEYLSKNHPQMTTTELSQIIDLVKTIETSALSRAKSELLAVQEAKQPTDNAKTRLSSLSEKAGQSITPATKTFTTDEISKMSADEFLRHEKSIMAQLRRGDFQR